MALTTVTALEQDVIEAREAEEVAYQATTEADTPEEFAEATMAWLAATHERMALEQSLGTLCREHTALADSLVASN